MSDQLRQTYTDTYGPHPVFTRTLMAQGIDLETARVMVALGHRPTQSEISDWLASLGPREEEGQRVIQGPDTRS